MNKNFKKVVKKICVITIIAVLLAIPISTFTEDYLTNPAAELMTLAVSGSLPTHKLDEQAIPMVYYRQLGEFYYNPVYVAMYGLAYFQEWSGSREYDDFIKYYQIYLPEYQARVDMYEDFLATADWLRNNLVIKECDNILFGIWEYNFPWDIYDLQAPWYSGMAQGVGTQVLVRAWQFTGDEIYLKAAELARNAFFIEVEDGGVTYKDSEEAWWYEEYAHPMATESRVLNGMQHALIGLNEFYELTGDEEAKLLFDKGIISLKSQTPLYDSNWWSYYDQIGTIANKKYHRINTNLTRKIYEITGDGFFLDIYGKWQKYNTPFFVREFIKQRPNYIDLTIFFLNVLALDCILLLLIFIKKVSCTTKWKCKQEAK